MLDYIVTCTKPQEGRIYSENFCRDEYFSDRDLHDSVMQFCKSSVELGWNVEAIDSNSKIIFMMEGFKRARDN